MLKASWDSGAGRDLVLPDLNLDHSAGGKILQALLKCTGEEIKATGGFMAELEGVMPNTDGRLKYAADGDSGSIASLTPLSISHSYHIGFIRETNII